MSEKKIFQLGIDPLYSISEVSKILKIHPRTLLKYEKLDLIKPQRNPKNNRRIYSGNDIQWVSCLMRLVHQDGYTLKTLSSVLAIAPCWVIKGCPSEVRENCEVFIHRDHSCWDRGKGKFSDIPCHECVYFNYFHRVKEHLFARNQKDSQEEAGSERLG